MGLAKTNTTISTDTMEIGCDKDTNKFCSACVKDANKKLYSECTKVFVYSGCGGVKVYAIITCVLIPLYVTLTMLSVWLFDFRSVVFNIVSLVVYTYYFGLIFS